MKEICSLTGFCGNYCEDDKVCQIYKAYEKGKKEAIAAIFEDIRELLSTEYYNLDSMLGMLQELEERKVNE